MHNSDFWLNIFGAFEFLNMYRKSHVFKERNDVGSARNDSDCTFSTFCTTFHGSHQLSSYAFSLVIRMNCNWSNLRYSIMSYSTYNPNDLYTHDNITGVSIIIKQFLSINLKSTEIWDTCNISSPFSPLLRPTYPLNASVQHLSVCTYRTSCMQSHFFRFHT